MQLTTLALAALAACAAVQDASGQDTPHEFGGHYADPNHPGCERKVVVHNTTSGSVYGADAAGGEGVACDGKTDTPWGPLAATFSSSKTDLKIVVDFSPKGGPSDLTGEWDSKNSAIQWADGNNWTKSETKPVPVVYIQ